MIHSTLLQNFHYSLSVTMFLQNIHSVPCVAFAAIPAFCILVGRQLRRLNLNFVDAVAIPVPAVSYGCELAVVSTIFEKLKILENLTGLIDDLGAEALMLEALEKVEKEIKKPLLRSDIKNMSLLQAEFEKINKKLGIRKEDLPKYEDNLELKIAKAELQELKKDAVEAMETQLKREEFKNEKMPDVRSLDIRNFL